MAARVAASSVAEAAKAAWWTLEAMSATLEWGCSLAVETVKFPFEFAGYGLDRIFGRGNSGRQLPDYEGPRTTAADVQQEFRAAAERRAEVRAAAAKRVSSIGMAMHDYASAIPALRPTVSLRDVPEHVTDWLLGLDEDELARLAKAGPHACSRAAEGRRCGIVGLHLPETYAEAATDRAKSSTYDVLQARIRNRLNRAQDYRAA